MSLEDEKRLRQKEGVGKLLKKEHQDEISEILAFGEKYKKEGEKMKKEFWDIGTRDNFVNLLLQYEESKKIYMEKLTEERIVLTRMSEGGKEKFIEAYLHDKILFSGDKSKIIEKKRYNYYDWIAGDVVMDEGVILELTGNNIGDEGAEAISKMGLKVGVTLSLSYNNIGDEGAEALSKMKLEEGVVLNLYGNNIGDAGVEAIVNNMKLKNGVFLDLRGNNISLEMEKKLMEWAQGYKDKGINCAVVV